MVKTILQNQQEVFQTAMAAIELQYNRTENPQLKLEAKNLLPNADHTPQVLLQRWKALDEDAKRVEKSVSLQLIVLFIECFFFMCSGLANTYKPVAQPPTRLEAKAGQH